MTIQPGWKVAPCSLCRGIGVVWSYTYDGPIECKDCNNGVVYISPKGRRALYPGGPFLGGGALDSELAVARPLALEELEAATK